MKYYFIDKLSWNCRLGLIRLRVNAILILDTKTVPIECHNRKSKSRVIFCWENFWTKKGLKSLSSSLVPYRKFFVIENFIYHISFYRYERNLRKDLNKRYFIFLLSSQKFSKKSQKFTRHLWPTNFTFTAHLAPKIRI